VSFDGLRMQPNQGIKTKNYYSENTEKKDVSGIGTKIIQVVGMIDVHWTI
jgi:hypothetical protein